MVASIIWLKVWIVWNVWAKHSVYGGGMFTRAMYIFSMSSIGMGVGLQGLVMIRNGGMLRGVGIEGALDFRAVSGIIVSRSCSGVRRSICDCSRASAKEEMVANWGVHRYL